MDYSSFPESSASRPHREPGHSRPLGARRATIEELLAEFTFAEQQRLRYLRRRFEQGKLTEFPERPAD